MIGSRFNGIVEQINYFPQELNTNRSGDWRSVEDEWERIAKGKRLVRSDVVIVPAGVPRTVEVEIKPQFKDNTRPRRPSSFNVKYWYNGAPQADPNGNATFTLQN